MREGTNVINLHNAVVIGWFLKHVNYKGPLARAVEIGYLKEFGQLNMFERLRDIEKEASNELILAVNQPHLELYYVDLFGNMHEIRSTEGVDYIAMGRAAYLAKKYIGDQEHEDDPFVGEHKDLDRVTLPFALRLAIGALKKAYKELNTGGNLDLVVVKQDGIDHYGDFIKKSMQRAENNLLQDIIERYEQPQRKLF